MFKQTLKVLITLILSVLLISSNTLAFHKDGKSVPKKTEWTGDAKEKKIYENKFKKNYCAYDADAKKIKGKAKIDDATGEPILGADNKPIFEEDTYKMNVEGHHSVEPISIGGKVLFPFNQNKNFDEHRFTLSIGEKTTLKDLLDYFCVQDISKPRPESFKGSYLENFYKEIAKDNGLVKADGSGDFKQKIGFGDIYDKIGTEGILIKDPNAVYYLSYNNLKQYEEYLDKKTKAKKDAKKAAARKQGNEAWISEHAQNWIDKITSKINEYDTQIEKSQSNLSKVKSLIEEYKNQFNNLLDKTNDVFADVDATKKEVKEKRKEVRDFKKEALKQEKLKELESNYTKVKKLKFKKYNNYTDLISLKKSAEKAKKNVNANKFIGKKKFSETFFGIKVSFGQSKIGIIEKFENLENDDLGKQYKIDNKKVLDLSDKLKEELKTLSEYDVQLDELVTLDSELDNKFPWNLLIIGVLVLLSVIGIVVYVYFNNKRLREIRENADKQVGSLKSDLEGKLKDTSEQIRSVGRTAAKAQQSGSTTEMEHIPQTPKTPEEIIAAKYDELVSEYKDSLEDFSKVAAFKQKWHGLALNRKERQDGTKTILINSNQAFEKSGIWCVNFDEKYFAFPGSTVKSNMATYMNMEFMKAGIDFKGVFSITEGSNYSTEPCVLKRGGAGFSVERVGKIVFPN
tara:strand:+ start:1863 stop:3914 length:2052 start_codon:yes stop_codon:yes gene_type:complete